MSDNKVSQLPPTLGIKDPETRQFLDALTNAWELRSGNTNKDSSERFLTAGELIDTISDLGSGAAGGKFGVTGPGSGTGSIAAAIGNLESSIRKSLLYQLLTTPLDMVSLDPLRRQIDSALAGVQGLDTGIRETNKSLTTATTSFTQQINSAVSRIGASEAAIVTEQNTRASADSALTSSLSVAVSRIGATEAAIISEQNTRAGADYALTNSLNAAVSRIGAAESAIVTETNTRSTKDNALASAVNTIWAAVGGNQAVIQDGQLAAVSPSAVAATKWNQVQAAAIDPNTGLPQSAIVRQELSAYASQVDGKLNAIYSVRAQVSRSGQTVVGGFGLAAVGGAAGGSGPEISFGVTADRFFIAPPSSSSDYNDATLIDSGTPTSFPFIALSTAQNVGGVVYQPGVYIRNANIANAAIDTAKIKDASITNAKIENLAVDTLKIAGGSVTTMTLTDGANSTVSFGTTRLDAVVKSISLPSGASGVVVLVTMNAIGIGGGTTMRVEINTNGPRTISSTAVSVLDNQTSSFVFMAVDEYPAVNPVYWVNIINTTPSGGAPIAYSALKMAITGGKR